MIISKNLWGQILFIQVFLIVFVIGFLPGQYQPFAYSTMYTVLFFTSAFNLDKHRIKMSWMASGAFLLEWISSTLNMRLLNAASNFLNGAFFVLIVAMLISQVARAKKVKGRVIFEAINGYLLLGVVFSLLIAVVAQIDPGAYSFSIDENWKTSEAIYYGFVTLSTLGYGDMLPLEQHSKALALLTTLGGQLYLAVIIALLVGKFSGQRS